MHFNLERADVHGKETADEKATEWLTMKTSL